MWYTSFIEHLTNVTAFSAMDAEVVTYTTEKRKLAAIKQKMMQELLTGRVRLGSLYNDEEVGDGLGCRC